MFAKIRKTLEDRGGKITKFSCEIKLQEYDVEDLDRNYGDLSEYESQPEEQTLRSESIVFDAEQEEEFEKFYYESFNKIGKGNFNSGNTTMSRHRLTSSKLLEGEAFTNTGQFSSIGGVGNYMSGSSKVPPIRLKSPRYEMKEMYGPEGNYLAGYPLTKDGYTFRTQVGGNIAVVKKNVPEKIASRLNLGFKPDSPHDIDFEY
jgi:hypothetical protein